MSGQMTYWDIWLVLLGLAGVTFFTRTFFLIIGAKIRLSERFQRAIRYAPAAALVAIIIPEFLPFNLDNPGQTFDWLSPKTWGGIFGLGAYLLSKNILITLFIGITVFTALRLFH